MPESRRDTDYLADILEAIQRILDYTAGQTWDQFNVDKKTQDAVVRNLEVLGEAAKLISPHLRKQSSHIPWKDITGTRDRLIHHYFGINREIVWEIIQHDLPSLLPQIQLLLDSFSTQSPKSL